MLRKRIHNHTYPMTSRDILTAFGLPPSSPIPLSYYHTGLVLDGVKVYITPARGGRHRVRATCPICSEGVSAGRLHQHMKVHTTKA